MSTPIDPEAVMSALRTRAPRAMHVAELCGEIDVEKHRRDEVLDVLDQLSSLGLVTEMPGLRFRLKKQKAPKPAETTQLQGWLTVHPRGFGFVAVEDGGPDVFVPGEYLGPALHGDRVEVHARPSPRGREGTIIGVLRRRTERITGIVRRSGKLLELLPDDGRLRPMTVRGEVPKEARGPGQVVIAKVIRWPHHADDRPEVEIDEILGVQGLTEVEVAKIKIRDGIVEPFPDDVLEEAAAIPAEVPEADKEGREDLRGLDLCTIDPPNARDHDDAVWAERRGSGYRVVIAIADVSHYVQEGTAIDTEALSRGCSIYLPDRAIPMLPKELSSNLASLVPDVDRLCMAVEVHLDKRGKIESYRFLEGVMQSRAKLTYEGVARALGLTEAGPTQPAAESRIEGLTVLLEVARILRQKRMQRGSLDFDLPEARVVLDEQEIEPIDVVRSRKDPGIREAYRMVEDLMLLANEVVAQDLAERGVPAIYRVHGPPDETKLASFCELAASLGFSSDVESAQDPKSLSKFLRKVEGAPRADVLNFLLLRAMQQAFYDTTPDVGHFGLGARHYLHFTSPIRRYPDLAVHRVVRKLARGESIDASKLKPKLQQQAADSSRLERRAMGAERDVVALYRTILMRDRVGEIFDGQVAFVEGFGFATAFDEPFVEAFTPVERLDDFYEVDELGIRLTGKNTGRSFMLGDRVRVRLEDANIQRRELVALPEEEPVGGTDRSTGDRPARRKRGPGRDRPLLDRSGGAKRGSGKGPKGKRSSRDKAGRDQPGGGKPSSGKPGGGKPGGGGGKPGKKTRPEDRREKPKQRRRKKR